MTPKIVKTTKRPASNTRDSIPANYNSVKKTSHAKEFFFYLLSTAMFFVSVISIVSLGFAFIEYFIPDPLTYYPMSTYGTIHITIAILAVVFPVFLIIQRILVRDMAEDSDIKDLKIRKWLLWLTFFVAVIALIIDGVTIIYNFLTGDLTLQFGLKLALVASASVFSLSYVRAEIRDYFDNSRISRGSLAIIASIKVVALIAIGFWITGGPTYQRALRADNQRINDLSMIVSNVASYYYETGTLPPDALTLVEHIKTFTIDPALEKLSTGEYSYEPLASNSFNLCAKFETGSEIDNQNLSRPKAFYGDNNDWSHPKGYYCFKKEVVEQMNPTEILPFIK